MRWYPTGQNGSGAGGWSEGSAKASWVQRMEGCSPLSSDTPSFKSGLCLLLAMWPWTHSSSSVQWSMNSYLADCSDYSNIFNKGGSADLHTQCWILFPWHPLYQFPLPPLSCWPQLMSFEKIQAIRWELPRPLSSHHQIHWSLHLYSYFLLSSCYQGRTVPALTNCSESLAL